MEKTKDVVTRVFANNFAGNLAYSMLSAVKTNNSDVLNIRADFLSDLGRSIDINTERLMLLGFNTTTPYSTKELERLSESNIVVAISPFVDNSKVTERLTILDTPNIGEYIKGFLEVYNLKSSLSDKFKEVSENNCGSDLSRYDSVRYLDTTIQEIGFARFSEQVGGVELVYDNQYKQWVNSHPLSPSNAYTELRYYPDNHLKIAFTGSNSKLDDVIIMYGNFLKEKGVNYVLKIDKIDVKRKSILFVIRSVFPNNETDESLAVVKHKLEKIGMSKIVLSKSGGYCLVILDFVSLFD